MFTRRLNLFSLLNGEPTGRPWNQIFLSRDDFVSCPLHFSLDCTIKSATVKKRVRAVRLIFASIFLSDPSPKEENVASVWCACLFKRGPRQTHRVRLTSSYHSGEKEREKKKEKKNTRGDISRFPASSSFSCSVSSWAVCAHWILSRSYKCIFREKGRRAASSASPYFEQVRNVNKRAKYRVPLIIQKRRRCIVNKRRSFFSLYISFLLSYFTTANNKGIRRRL